VAVGLTDLRKSLLELILAKGHERKDQPFQLSSGSWSHDYIDGKRAIASGEDLRLAASCIVELASESGVEFDAIGGPTMGADALAHAVSVLTGKRWFSVRKEPKGHGKQKLIEGAELRSGEKVLLVEDIVTTARSILQAFDAVQAVGAQVVLAMTIVDRGEVAGRRLAERGIRYEPLLTFKDLRIEAV
jgi:orotate phosphoribosyltransferase